jgi:hypothetical protein
VLLKYRAYVKPVVCSARIAKLLVSYRPFFNFIDTVLQLLTPINREGEEIERRTWSHFEACVFMYVLLKYRAYVKPVVCSARIAKLLVSYIPFFNFIDTVLQLLTPINREGEEIERRT